MLLALTLHIIISLLTCEPGEELYAKFGHTAIRVVDTEEHLDVVYNYGLFDFRQPNFYGRFVEGKTYYQIGEQDIYSFYFSYVREGRRIYNQQLRLTDEQAAFVRDSLLRNMEPRNREYLYNFVFDNCATRPARLIETATGTSLHGAPADGLTYRQLISRYVGENHYAMFGINLLFGPQSDQVADSLFLPECLMRRLAATDLIAYQDLGDFEAPIVRWYEDIRTWLAAFALALLALTAYDIRRKHLSWQVDLLLIILYILALALVTYLTFWSLHPLVGFGWRLLIIPAIHLCSRLFYFVPSRC